MTDDLNADTTTDEERAAKLVELLNDMPIAMMTTFAGGRPRSNPMARQDVETAAEVWFITARDAEHVHAIQAEPRVALSYSSRDAWVSLSGWAELVDDNAKLAELWSTFAEAWLPGGPEDPQAALIRVQVETGEYWDTPGGRIASLVSFAKTKLTGDTYDADHGTVEP